MKVIENISLAISNCIRKARSRSKWSNVTFQVVEKTEDFNFNF